MKTIINAKNALYALFIIEVLRQTLFLIFTYSFSHINELISHILMACICLYLAYNKNEYITTKKQKIALYCLSFYHVFCKLISPILLISNTDYIDNPMIEHFVHLKVIVESISIALFIIAFLTLIWGFKIKTLYKKWITILYFLPIINMGIWMLICPIINQIINKDLTRIEYLLETIYIQSISNIIAYSLMLWLIHKGYKIKNKIQ